MAGKLGGAAVSLFAVLVTSFFLFRLIPGDPVKQMTGGGASRPSNSTRCARSSASTCRSWQQFTDYCGNALTGDFGTSYQFHAPVIDKITEALPATLLLTGTAFVLYTAHRHLAGHPHRLAQRQARRPLPHRRSR